MKVIDKVGILCLVNISIMTIFYWTSSINMVLASAMQLIGVISVGIMTINYQEKLTEKKNEM